MPTLFQKKSTWAWLLCGILLAGFLFNSISDYVVARENVRKTLTESTLPLTSDNVYSEIQRDLLRPVFIASLMANDTFLRDWAINGEQDQMTIFIKMLVELPPMKQPPPRYFRMARNGYRRSAHIQLL